MRILTSSIVLDRSGVPTYTLTMCRELHRLGHDVMVYSPLSGSLADKFHGIARVTGNLSDLATFNPEIIIAQNNKCARNIRAALPRHPMIFSAHGVEPEGEQPPRDIQIDFWITINEIGRSRLIEQHISSNDIMIVRDFIDLDEFKPTRPADFKREHPLVLFISNYKKWKNYAKLSKACESIGFELRAIGAPYGRSDMVADEINRADIVVTWGRGILEAMACGRPALSYDKEFGDGLIANIFDILDGRQHNFGCLQVKHFFTHTRLARELLKVRKLEDNHGARMREYISDEHDVRKVVSGPLMQAINTTLRRSECRHEFRDTAYCVQCGWRPLVID